MKIKVSKVSSWREVLKYLCRNYYLYDCARKWTITWEMSYHTVIYFYQKTVPQNNPIKWAFLVLIFLENRSLPVHIYTNKNRIVFVFSKGIINAENSEIMPLKFNIKWLHNNSIYNQTTNQIWKQKNDIQELWRFIFHILF